MTRLPNFAGRAGRSAPFGLMQLLSGAAGEAFSSHGCAGPGWNSWKPMRQTQDPDLRASTDGAGSAGRPVGELLAAAETADRKVSQALPAALADAQERRIRLQAAKAELEKAGPKPICGTGSPSPGTSSGDKPRRVAPTPRGTDTLNPTDP